jgi:hypothetical protein
MEILLFHDSVKRLGSEMSLRTKTDVLSLKSEKGSHCNEHGTPVCLSLNTAKTVTWKASTSRLLSIWRDTTWTDPFQQVKALLWCDLAGYQCYLQNHNNK